MTFNIWKENPPPKYTWVWAQYELKDDWRLVRTCGRGCCVSSYMGMSMLLPRYWREATVQEAEQEEALITKAGQT